MSENPPPQGALLLRRALSLLLRSQPVASRSPAGRASFSFTILPPAPSPLPTEESALLRAFVELVRHRDKGGLSLAPVFTRARFTRVYFGGGTPSLLPAPAMRRIFEALYRTFDVPDGTQVIFEGNPDSLTEAKIEVLARLGRVSRLTVGVQTMDEEVQRRVRRFNKPEQVATAVRAARAMGIRHVNVDLMAGLPGQSLESFQRDLDFLLALEPDSIHLNSYRPLPRERAAGRSRSQAA